MIVNTESHPNIMEALHCIESDTGNTLAVPVKDIPDRWREHLSVIENVIAGLSRKERAPEEEPLPAHVKPHELLDSEFYSFCNAEYDAMIAMSNRSSEHMLAHIFLTDFFEDWTYTQEEGPNTPQGVANQRRIEFLQMLERETSLGLTHEQSDELDKLLRELA